MTKDIAAAVAQENAHLRSRLEATGITGPQAKIFWTLGNGFSNTALDTTRFTLLMPLELQPPLPRFLADGADVVQVQVQVPPHAAQAPDMFALDR